MDRFPNYSGSILKVVVVAAISLLFAGCSSNRIWQRDGTKYDQMRRDLAQCRFEGERSSLPYVPGSGLGMLIASTSTKGNIIEQCMLAKGYSRVSKKSAPEYAKHPNVAIQQLKPPQPSIEIFRDEDFAPYAGIGNSSIRGQAFLKTRTGEVKLGAGNEVFLCPVTAYSTEYFRRMIVANVRLLPPDERIIKYFKATVADSSGNFEFKGLPAGEYYLGCKITWEFQGINGWETTGGIGYAMAKVGADESIRVIVTK